MPFSEIRLFAIIIIDVSMVKGSEPQEVAEKSRIKFVMQFIDYPNYLKISMSWSPSNNWYNI
jgi:hypothetical protein